MVLKPLKLLNDNVTLLTAGTGSSKENTDEVLHDEADLAKMGVWRTGKPEPG